MTIRYKPEPTPCAGCGRLKSAKVQRGEFDWTIRQHVIRQYCADASGLRVNLVCMAKAADRERKGDAA